MCVPDAIQRAGGGLAERVQPRYWRMVRESRRTTASACLATSCASRIDMMCASWEVASSISSFLVWHHRWLPPSYQRSSQQYGPLVLRLNEILHPLQGADVVHELTTNPVLLPLDDPRVVLVAGHQVVENLLIANEQILSAGHTNDLATLYN